MKTLATLTKAVAVGITGAIVGGIIYGAGWLNGAITVAAGSNDKSDKAADTGRDESSGDSCDKSGPDIQMI